MVILLIKIVRSVMMLSTQFVVSMVLLIKIFVSLENVLEFKLLTMDLVEFLTIEDQKIEELVNVLSNLIQFVVQIS